MTPVFDDHIISDIFRYLGIVLEPHKFRLSQLGNATLAQLITRILGCKRPRYEEAKVQRLSWG